MRKAAYKLQLIISAELLPRLEAASLYSLSTKGKGEGKKDGEKDREDRGGKRDVRIRM